MPDCTSGEFRDATDLTLTGVQEELVEAVVATGTPTVVVVMSGRAHSLTRIADSVPAILLAWLPGEEGGHAVAETLFGIHNPAGRLPVSLPANVGQIPVYYNHKSGGARSQMYGDYTDAPTQPLYAFGHGLSYTEFRYSALTISPSEVPLAELEPIEISLDVENVGDLAGDEVVQLYVRDPIASVTRPVQQLAGFERIHLRAGEKRRLRFALDPSQLAFYDTAMQFVIEPGAIEIQVGGSCRDIRARGEFEFVGVATAISPNALTATTATLDGIEVAP
jgi:beta-glucosidase